MSNFFKKIVNDSNNHLEENNVSYCEHLKRSLYYSSEFFFGTYKAIVHSFIPAFYTHSTSDIIKNIEKDFKND
tara:strand:- start:202 stop:420 length:219 start_codon:yes stop_codon:yes gene_type:complete